MTETPRETPEPDAAGGAPAAYEPDVVGGDIAAAPEPADSHISWSQVGVGDDPAPGAPIAAATPRRPRRFGALTGAWIAAALVIVALLGLTTFLFVIHAQYVSQNNQLRNEATTLGNQVAQAKVVNDHQAAELATIDTQLAQAKARISTLANVAAQAGDDRLALVDVASNLVQCANQRQTLIGYLKQASLYTPSSLRASEAQITAFCTKAEDVFASIVSGG